MIARVFQTITGYLLSFNFWGPVLLILLLALLLKEGKKRGKAYTHPVKIILIITVVRFILFGNPLSWMLYGSVLSPDDVGYRQCSVIRNEWKRFELKQKSSICAVGSSQTGAIYNRASENGEVQIYSMSGMGPIDLYFNRNYIRQIKPQKILLYLSEFDLAHKPHLTGIKLSPRQGLTILPSLLQFDQVESRREKIDMLVCELLPEYKYSYIFRGLITKLARLEQIEPPSPEKQFEQLTQNLTNNLSDKYIELNSHFLKLFLEEMKKAEIPTIILEGQYYPDCQSLPRNKQLRELCVNEIKLCVEKCENTHFYSLNKTYQFKKSEYNDPYHVNDLAGERFVNYLFSNILAE